MMQHFLKLTFVLSLITGAIFGQTYQQLVKQADSLYKARAYDKSHEKYQLAFSLEKGSPNDLYNAACSAALAGDNKNAFKLLQVAFKNGWMNIDHLKADGDLKGLHTDKRWTELVAVMQAKVDSIESHYDKPLQRELLQIFKDDQEIRYQYIDLSKRFGHNNPKLDSLRKIILFKDSVNLLKVTRILDERGWVGKDKVGGQANQTLFLVIQHSDLKTQEKYLPMMRSAVKEGNATASSLALLEDRVALQQGKRQIFGSQIYSDPHNGKQYIAPLEDPDNVDKRRQEVGLGPLAEYAKRWDIVWDVENYKLQLPQYLQWQQEMMKQSEK